MEMDFTSVQIACAAISLLCETTKDDTQLDDLIKKQKAEKAKNPKKKPANKKSNEVLKQIKNYVINGKNVPMKVKTVKTVKKKKK